MFPKAWISKTDFKMPLKKLYLSPYFLARRLDFSAPLNGTIISDTQVCRSEAMTVSLTPN